MRARFAEARNAAAMCTIDLASRLVKTDTNLVGRCLRVLRWPTLARRKAERFIVLTSMKTNCMNMPLLEELICSQGFVGAQGLPVESLVGAVDKVCRSASGVV